MIMKKTFTGWIPRSFKGDVSKIKDPMYDMGGTGTFAMFKTKDRKSDWADKDWPPVKVKITVETL